MKNRILIIAVVFLATCFASNAQKKRETNDVPKVVYSAFGEQYPDAQVVQWEMPGSTCYKDWISSWEQGMSEEYPMEYTEPNTFHVTYKYQNNEQRSVYYRDGQWVQTRTKINKESIPEAVMYTVNNLGYGDWDVADYAFLVEKPLEKDRRDVFFKIYLKKGIKRQVMKVNFDGTLKQKNKLYW